MEQDAEASTASRGRRALEESFDALYDLLLRMAERSLVGLTDSAFDAADIVQLAYVAAFKKPHLFAGGSRRQIRKILCGFVRIEVRRAQRRARIVLEARVSWRRSAPESPEPGELARSKEWNERILAAFEKLPPVERAVAVLVFGHEMPIGEVSEYLHVKKETVSKCRYRALKKLRVALRDIGGES